MSTAMLPALRPQVLLGGWQSPSLPALSGFFYSGFGMHYTAKNSASAQVWDVERKQKFENVVSVDTDRGEVTMYKKPPIGAKLLFRLETEIVSFKKIHPIFGEGYLPCLFHCYGRIQ